MITLYSSIPVIFGKSSIYLTSVGREGPLISMDKVFDLANLVEIVSPEKSLL